MSEEILQMPETAQPKKPSICICMIVKNEEKRLPACLNSMQGFYDTLVIVDTGSTDRTMEIAKEYGAQLYEHEWVDFSDARNVSLKHADPDCDWIGIVDADEELEPIDFPLIYSAMMSEDIGGLVIQVLHDTTGGWSMQVMERFFRPGSSHYEGKKHNQLINAHHRQYIPARLYHYGYNLRPQEMLAKYERDIVLLELELEENPDNVYSTRNYVRALISMSKYEEAIEMAEGLLARESNLEIPDLSMQMTLMDLGRSHGALGDTGKAIQYFGRLILEYPANIDAHFYLAKVHFEDANYSAALQLYVDYIKLLFEARNGLATKFNIVESWGLEWVAYNNMANCHAELGNILQALDVMKISALQAFEGQLDVMLRFFRKNIRHGGDNG